MNARWSSPPPVRYGAAIFQTMPAKRPARRRQINSDSGGAVVGLKIILKNLRRNSAMMFTTAWLMRRLNKANDKADRRAEASRFQDGSSRNKISRRRPTANGRR